MQNEQVTGSPIYYLVYDYFRVFICIAHNYICVFSVKHLPFIDHAFYSFLFIFHFKKRPIIYILKSSASFLRRNMQIHNSTIFPDCICIPPPQAKIQFLFKKILSITLLSSSLKYFSPCNLNMLSMLFSSINSITLSISINNKFNFFDIISPTVLLPEPIKPISAIFLKLFKVKLMFL